MLKKKCKTLILSPDSSLATDLHDITEIIWIPIIRLNSIQGSSLKFLESAKRCNNIAFTSPRAVKALIDDAMRHSVLEELMIILRKAFIAVIASKTGEEVLRQVGRPPDYVATKHYSKNMFLELIERFKINCLIIPRSSESSKEINYMAERLGVNLIDIEVYRPEPLIKEIERASEIIRKGSIDIIIFSSTMIAKLICESLSDTYPIKTKVIAMGETTFQNVPKHCIEPSALVVGDGSVETLKSIITNLCRHM